MNAIYNKIIGYLLLAVGLGMIFWGVNSAYGIFSGQSVAPEVFKIENRDLSEGAKKTKVSLESKDQNDSQAQIQSAIGNEIGSQLKEMLPIDFLPKIMNLISWSLFIGILIFAGSQVSGLGIKLAKD